VRMHLSCQVKLLASMGKACGFAKTKKTFLCLPGGTDLRCNLRSYSFFQTQGRPHDPL
jgi:hypothetical protein